MLLDTWSHVIIEFIATVRLVKGLGIPIRLLVMKVNAKVAFNFISSVLVEDYASSLQLRPAYDRQTTSFIFEPYDTSFSHALATESAPRQSTDCSAHLTIHLAIQFRT